MLRDMYVQSRIFERVASAAGEARIRLRTAAESLANRTGLGRRVCEEFGFYDAPGWPQQASCVKALRRLEERGRITLPAPRNVDGGSAPRGIGQPVPVSASVPSRVDAVEGLSLVLVGMAGAGFGTSWSRESILAGWRGMRERSFAI